MCDNELDALRLENQILKQQVHHWKANHDNQVKAARKLKCRTDIPESKKDAYDKLVIQPYPFFHELILILDSSSSIYAKVNLLNKLMDKIESIPDTTESKVVFNMAESIIYRYY
ncbi:hypothetical protein MM5_167 [Morganella phage vB_Mm5]